MGRTLEDEIGELERLLMARDGDAASWTFTRTRGSAIGVYDCHNLALAHGSSLAEAVRNACVEIVASARRVMQAQ